MQANLYERSHTLFNAFLGDKNRAFSEHLSTIFLLGNFKIVNILKMSKISLKICKMKFEILNIGQKKIHLRFPGVGRFSWSN